MRCVLGETLDLLAPYRMGSQSACTAWQDRKAGDLGEIHDSEVVEGSLGQKDEGVNHSLESRGVTHLESMNLSNALSSLWVGHRPMSNSLGRIPN